MCTTPYFAQKGINDDLPRGALNKGSVNSGTNPPARNIKHLIGSPTNRVPSEITNWLSTLRGTCQLCEPFNHSDQLQLDLLPISVHYTGPVVCRQREKRTAIRVSHCQSFPTNEQPAKSHGPRSNPLLPSTTCYYSAPSNQFHRPPPFPPHAVM